MMALYIKTAHIDCWARHLQDLLLCLSSGAAGVTARHMGGSSSSNNNSGIKPAPSGSMPLLVPTLCPSSDIQQQLG
jgi:hypothetical protein